MMRAFWRLFGFYRDARAIARGRVPQRLFNRGVSKVVRGVARRFYR